MSRTEGAGSPRLAAGGSRFSDPSRKLGQGLVEITLVCGSDDVDSLSEKLTIGESRPALDNLLSDRLDSGKRLLEIAPGERAARRFPEHLFAAAGRRADRAVQAAPFPAPEAGGSCWSSCRIAEQLTTPWPAVMTLGFSSRSSTPLWPLADPEAFCDSVNAGTASQPI